MKIKIINKKIVEGREEMGAHFQSLADGEYQVQILPADSWAIAEEIVSDYSQHSDTLPLHDLMRMQDRLATVCTTLARETGLAHGQMVKTYGGRKVAFAKKVAELSSTPLPGTDKPLSRSASETAANEYLADVIEDEAEAEELAKVQQLLLSSYNKVLDAISQRISYAKQERYRNGQQ